MSEIGGRGPAPKHPSTRARRNAPTANLLQLPAEGRTGPTPAWPLPVDRELRGAVDIAQTEAGLLEDEVARCDDDRERDRLRRQLRRALAHVEVAESDLRISEDQELALWETLWRLPQAVAWDKRAGLYLNEVAQYVRWKTRAELGELNASREARMLGDRLGLTPASLLHLRWEIVGDELAGRRGEPDPAPTKRVPARKPGKRADPRGALKAV